MNQSQLRNGDATIQHGEAIISNQVLCLLCGDKPYSRHRHDFQWCRCGAVAVDGGQSYLRRVYKQGLDQSNIIDISIIVSNKTKQEMIDETEKTAQRGSSTYGLVCAVLRALRDSGEKISFNEGDINERSTH